MDSIPLIPLISRWIHILSAVTFAGATFYMFISLRGAMSAALDDETRERFRSEAMSRWKHIVALTFVLIFGSGFYNYLAVTRHVHPEQPLYHALFGTKFLLAIAAFAFAFIVTSTMGWSEKLRDKSWMWLLAVLSAAAVILIAGVMKVMPAG